MWEIRGLTTKEIERIKKAFFSAAANDLPIHTVPGINELLVGELGQRPTSDTKLAEELASLHEHPWKNHDAPLEFDTLVELMVQRKSDHAAQCKQAEKETLLGAMEGTTLTPTTVSEKLQSCGITLPYNVAAMLATELRSIEAHTLKRAVISVVAPSVTVTHAFMNVSSLNPEDLSNREPAILTSEDSSPNDAIVPQPAHALPTHGSLTASPDSERTPSFSDTPKSKDQPKNGTLLTRLRHAGRNIKALRSIRSAGLERAVREHRNRIIGIQKKYQDQQSKDKELLKEARKTHLVLHTDGSVTRDCRVWMPKITFGKPPNCVVRAARQQQKDLEELYSHVSFHVETRIQQARKNVGCRSLHEKRLLKEKLEKEAPLPICPLTDEDIVRSIASQALSTPDPSNSLVENIARQAFDPKKDVSAKSHQSRPNLSQSPTLYQTERWDNSSSSALSPTTNTLLVKEQSRAMRLRAITASCRESPSLRSEHPTLSLLVFCDDLRPFHVVVRECRSLAQLVQAIADEASPLPAKCEVSDVFVEDPPYSAAFRPMNFPSDIPSGSHTGMTKIPGSLEGRVLALLSRKGKPLPAKFIC